MFLRWRDPEYMEMAKSFFAEGRVYDKHIGFPRKSRSEHRKSA
jgi:hypothetical protein